MGKFAKDEKNWMIIRVTDMDLKDAFLAKCAKAGLSISNDGETDRGIEHLVEGNSISVGTSEKFQINWARNIDYYANRGIVPVYDISLDWSKIVKRLNDYIANQESTKDVDLDSGDTYKIEESGDSVTFNKESWLEFTKEELDVLKKFVNLGINASYNEESEELVLENEDCSVTITANELEAIELN